MIFRHFSVYLAVIGILSGVYMVQKLRRVPPAPAPLAEPTRSPYKRFVAATGIIEARRENVQIATPRPGLVTAVYVEVGALVRSNTPLLQLDDRDARARLRVAKSQLTAVESSRQVETVAIADWTEQFERVVRLEKSNVATEDERRRKEFAIQSARARLARIEADIESARAQIQSVETELEILTVRAPRDGRILQVNVRAGEYANLVSPTPLMILGDVNQLQIRADVDEQNAPLVTAGEPGTGFLKGSNDHQMPLRFVRIEPFVVPKKSLTGDSSERVDTRVLQIIFEFDPPSFPIYVGQQVDVFIRRPEAN
jgi:RND family efflux transporter MFP subunit